MIRMLLMLLMIRMWLVLLIPIRLMIRVLLVPLMPLMIRVCLQRNPLWTGRPHTSRIPVPGDRG